MLTRTIIGLSFGIILIIIGIVSWYFYSYKDFGFITFIIGGIIFIITVWFEPSEEKNE